MKVPIIYIPIINSSLFGTTVSSKIPKSCNYQPYLYFLFFKVTGSVKGQLILKYPFGVFKSPKKPRQIFPGFLP